MFERVALLFGALFCGGCVLPEPSWASFCGVTYTCHDETVVDSKTGLTWQRNLPATYAGCTGRGWSSPWTAGDSCYWEEANAYCDRLELVGDGWRLPTKGELLSIVDNRMSPSIDVEGFPNTPPYSFWSSSLEASSPGSAWYVNFGNGGSSDLSRSAELDCMVRCVR